VKEKFAGWAREVGVPTEEKWTVEQIADALIAAKAAWPHDLTNEEGWQLWSAVMRRECSVQSIQWDEVTSESGGDPLLEVTFRLQDKREFATSLPKSELLKKEFGGLCKELEDRLREWKAADDIAREEALRKSDEEWLTRAPDLMDYVIGFRAWQLNGARLKPIGMGNDVWEGGAEVRASCVHGKLHRSPSHDCECGLYAWNSFAGMENEARGNVEGKVWGVVRACGRLEVHPTGFRAEFMQPVLLGYDDSEDVMTVEGVTRGSDFERVTKIAELLGNIPVVPFDVMTEAAKEFGRVIEDTPGLLPDEGAEESPF
jgi:hypothetical protein